MKADNGSRDSLFEEAAAAFGPALERLARAYEADPDACHDLMQEILIALWRSFAGFDGWCSLRTWVYRVAHNTAASHVARRMRTGKRVFVDLEDVAELADTTAGEGLAGQRDHIAWVYELIDQLKPLDRQVMVAYLEGIDAASTAEITGLSARNVATKIHRIKRILARRFQALSGPVQGPRQGGRDAR
jgi:RNA polymerase sigma-70 factor (ECF subfamily)